MVTVAQPPPPTLEDLAAALAEEAVLL